MEDEPTDGAGGAPVPDSLLPYDSWMQDAFRGVVVRALEHAGREGLPEGHHFYITFRTGYPGVQIPVRLREQYPQEMTIVLQHQFWDLAVEDAVMSVGLSFGGVGSTLVVPIASLTAFADPYVQFGLRLQPLPVPEPMAAVPPSKAPAGVTPATAPAAEAAAEAPQVVSLDAFRRRRE